VRQLDGVYPDDFFHGRHHQVDLSRYTPERRRDVVQMLEEDESLMGRFGRAGML
jgi:hypothetical protein